LTSPFSGTVDVTIVVGRNGRSSAAGAVIGGSVSAAAAMREIVETRTGVE